MPEDDGEDDGAAGEDDMDGNADLAEMMQTNFDDDDDIAELVEEDVIKPNEKEEDREMIETVVDPDEW